MGQKIKKMLSSEKGSITVLVVAAMLFMIVILVLSFMGVSNKKSAQMSNIKQIESEYGAEQDIGEVYKETIETIDRVGDIKITPSTTEWTNSDVIATIEYEKQLTENRKAGIGSANTPNATSLTLTENGTVYAEAYTKDGHRRNASLQIKNIDKVKPTAIIRTNGGSYVMPTKGDKATIKTRVSVSDLGGSELKDVKYAWSQSKDVEPTTWQTFADGDTLTKNDCTIGTYYLWLNVTDNAGNRADTKVSNAFIVRDSSNAMDNITFKIEPDGWTNDDVKVTVIYGDNLTENRKAGPEGEELKPNATIVTMTENGKVIAEAEDPAGNKVIAEIDIDKIDKVAPVIKTITNPSNGNWTNKDVTVTLVAEDNLSGIKEFQWFENGEWTTRELVTDPEKGTGTITYTADRDTTIRFRVIDNAGNISEEKTTVLKIDKTKPTHTGAEIKNITTTGYDVYVYGVTDGSGSGVNRVQFPTWTDANGQDDIQSNWGTSASAAGVKQADGTTWVYHVNVTDHKNEYGKYRTHIYIYDNLGNVESFAINDIQVPGVVITFNANGGTVTEGTRTKGYASQMGTLPTPTRTGYTFTGWFTATTGGTRITDTTTVPANNVTYYAQWTINNYTVTYDNNYYANSIWNDTTVLGRYAQAGTTPKSRTNVADANAKDGNYIKFVMPAGTSGGPYYSPTAKLTAGKTYTWSVYVKASTNKTILIGDEQNGQKNVNVTTNWQKITYTFTAIERQYVAFTFYANSGGWADGEELYVHSLEIMEGTPTHTTASKQYNSALGTLPAPTRTGYTFTGWYTAPVGGTKISDTTTVPANNVTYYAHWTTNTYKITYNLNGGTANGPTSFNVGTETITLPTPTKNGYTFTGWTGSNGTTPQKTVTIGKGSTGDKTYTANWTATNYTISYNLNGGTISGQPTSYNIESNDITLPTPTKTGYTFTGWTGSNGTTPQTTVKIPKGSTENKSYTANWSINSYFINLNLNVNGTEYTSGYNSRVTVGFKVGGVDKGYIEDYYTQHQYGTSWEIYGLRLDGQDVAYKASGTVGAGDATILVNLNTINFVPSNSSYGTVSVANRLVVRGSKYTASGATVTLDGGRTITATKTDATGYTTNFTNWTPASGTVNSATTVTANFTRTANSYTLSYNANGGTGSMATDTVTYNTNYTTKANAFTRTGYTFKGWNEKADGTGTDWTSWIGKPWQWTYARNVTLYAQWTRDTYTISYNLNGGAISGQPTNYNVESNAITLPTPTRTGYTFTGWTGTNGTTPQTTVTIPKGSTGNRNYTANWSINSYNIDLNLTIDGTAYNSGDSRVTVGLKVGGVDKGYVKDYNTAHQYNTVWEIYGLKLDGESVAYTASGTLGAANADVRVYLNTVTFKVNNGSYGTVSVANRLVARGTTYSTSGTTLTLAGGRKVTATATAATGYTTVLSSWSPASGTVNSATTVTANFTRTPNDYTLTINPNGGTWGGKTTNSTATQKYNTTKNLGTATPPAGYAVTFNGNGGTSAQGSITSTKSFSSWTKSGSGSYIPSVANPTTGGMTMTKKTDTDGMVYYNYAYNVSGLTGNTWYSSRFPAYAYTAGSTYEIRFKVRVNSSSGGDITFRHAALGNDYGTPGLVTKGFSSATSGWQDVTMTRTFTGTTTTLNNNTVTIAPVFEFYTGNLMNRNAAINFDVKDIQIINTSTGAVVQSSNNSYLYGAGAGTVTANYTNNAITLPNATRNGYTFNGWYTAASGGTKIGNAGAQWTPTAATTLYAQWTPVTYTIGYTLNGGSISGQPTSYTVESNAITLPTPTRTGYTFTGWTGSNGTTAQTTVTIEKGSTGNKSYTANWKINQYTIDLNLNVDGTSYGSGYNSRVTVGFKVGGVDKGYIQDYCTANNYGTTWEIYGLKLDGEAVAYTASGTLGAGNANVLVNLNTITFKANNASYGTVSAGSRIVVRGTTYSSSGATVTLAGGRTVTAAVTAATGYTTNFSSWSPASGTVNAATTVTANFTRAGIVYTVNLNGQSATSAGSTAVYQKYGTGIYKESTCTNQMTTSTNAITKPSRSYTLTYDANGGSVSPASTTASYTFGGYYTATGGGGDQLINANGNITTAFATTKYSANATLYAKWTNNSISLATPTRAGYTFKGWFTAKSGGTQITSATSITSNQTIYAQWTANNYTVTYDYNGTKNYARVEDSGKTITGFTGITNYCPSLYTLNISGLAANDKLRLTFDLEYTGLTTAQSGYKMWVQGNGNITAWTPGISWPALAPTGTGKIHYDNVMTLSADQVKNSTFSLNLRTDYYSAGTLKVTNFKVTRVTTKAETKACGSQLGTLPTVNEAGFTLNGWYTAASGGTKIATTTTMPPNNVTYYAQWTPNKYTVNYNANGGTGTMASDTATYEANYTTKANTFTRANYVFAGWNEKADGTGTDWTSWIGKPWKWNYTYGITLYAQWTVANYSVNTNPITYTVTLAQAVAAASSAGGSTITLLRDYTDTSGVAIDRNVTLTTNGKTLTRNSTITVNSGKTLTVTGTGTLQTGSAINLITNKGTLNVSHTGTMKNTNTSTVTNPGTVSVINNTGTLSITTAVTMTTAAKISDPTNVDPIAAVRNESSGTATIENAKISGTDGAVVSLGKLTLKSGTITGGRHHAVHNRSGTFNMTGGSVIRTGTDSYSALCNYLTGNTTISGGSVSGNKTAISTYSGTLTISGGSVTCSTETAILHPEGYKGTIDISNATIYGNARGIINRGILKVSGANTKITGNTSHGVWNTSGATMTMSSGTITANAGYAVISNEGNFTMNGGTLTKTVTNASLSGVVLTNYDGASINITGGTITNASSATTAAVILEGGTLNMSGGTINAKQHGIIIKGSSNVRTTGGTIMGNSNSPVISVNGTAKAEFINTTIKSNYTADPYAVYNNTGSGGNCIIRSRASNFGLTGRVGKLVIATTNTSTGQASELVRIYNASTNTVFFPTWTNANGQDDIQWYKTSKYENYNGIWINKSSHGNQTGLYNVHIYDSADGGTARNNIGALSLNF